MMQAASRNTPSRCQRDRARYRRFRTEKNPDSRLNGRARECLRGRTETYGARRTGRPGRAVPLSMIRSADLTKSSTDGIFRDFRTVKFFAGDIALRDNLTRDLLRLGVAKSASGSGRRVIALKMPLPIRPTMPSVRSGTRTRGRGPPRMLSIRNRPSAANRDASHAVACGTRIHPNRSPRCEFPPAALAQYICPPRALQFGSLDDRLVRQDLRLCSPRRGAPAHASPRWLVAEFARRTRHPHFPSRPR